MQTGDEQLVWIPAGLAVGMFLLAWMTLRWRRRKLLLTGYRRRGHRRVLLLGFSLFLLSGVCIFVSLFFLITR